MFVNKACLEDAPKMPERSVRLFGIGPKKLGTKPICGSHPGDPAHTNGELFVTIEVYENDAIASGCRSPHAVRHIGAADRIQRDPLTAC